MSIKDSVFAKLVVNAQFLSHEQLAECLDAQSLMADERGNKPRLFDVMLQKGYISRQQLQTILEGYDQKAKRLFGEIGIKWNLISQEQLDECLALQSQMKQTEQKVPRIGQLLVSRNYLKKHQVKAILEEQNKKIARCPGCGASFNIRGVTPGAKIKCTQCGKTLALLEEKEPPLDADATMVREAAPAFKERPQQQARANTQFGDFQILDPLGQDSTGSIYKAKKGNDQKVVALKIFNKDACEDSEYIEELKGNVQRVARLSHPNLKRVFAMGTVQGTYYVSTEYVEGESLRNILVRDGKISIKKSLVISSKVCQALKYIHEQGVFHGEIRPSNILISTDGRVVLSSLGLTPKITENILTIVDSGQLAPFYIAPEQVVEDRKVDYRADVYSLGATIYHLVAGRPPFEGQSPFEVLIRFTEDFFPPPQVYNPEVPQAVSRVIQKMVAAEPDERYQSLDELIHDLEHPEEARLEGAAAAEKEQPSPQMEALLHEDSGLQRLARPAAPPSSAGKKVALVALLLVAAGALVVATNPGLLGGKGASGPKTPATEAFERVQSLYVRDRDSFDAQPELLRQCQNWLKNHTDGSPKEKSDVQSWITYAQGRQAEGKSRRVTGFRGRIAAAVADRDYPRARRMWDDEKDKQPWPEWRAAAEELDREIKSEEKKTFAALAERAGKHEADGKFDLALQQYAEVAQKFSDPAFEEQAKAERSRLEGRIRERDQAQAASREAASLAEVNKAIEETKKPEMVHNYGGAISRLAESRPKALPVHHPALDKRVQELALQQKCLEHLFQVDLNKIKLSVQYAKKPHPVEGMRPDGIRLKGLPRMLRWDQVEDKEIFLLVHGTLGQTRLPEELSSSLGMFAARHGMPFEALRLFHRAAAKVPAAAGYLEETKQAVQGDLAAALAKCKAASPAPAQLQESLAAEHRFRAGLEFFPAHAGQLQTIVRAAYQGVVGAGGTLVTLDEEAPLDRHFKGHGKGAARQTENGNGFLQLLRARAEAVWPAKGSLSFLLRVPEGDGRLEVNYGALKSIWTLSTDRTAVSLIVGGANEHLQDKSFLAPHAQWHLVELKIEGDQVSLHLDGKKVSTKPLGAAGVGGTLELKASGTSAFELDLIRTAGG